MSFSTPKIQYDFDRAFAACVFGKSQTLSEALASSPACLDMLNRDQWSLLQSASRHGHLDCIDTLLAHGANPNLIHLGNFYSGWSCAMIALDNRHIDAASALFAAGANPLAFATDAITSCATIARRIQSFSDISLNETRILDAILGAIDSESVAQHLRGAIPEIPASRSTPRI